MAGERSARVGNVAHEVGGDLVGPGALLDQRAQGAHEGAHAGVLLLLDGGLEVGEGIADACSPGGAVGLQVGGFVGK